MVGVALAAGRAVEWAVLVRIVLSWVTSPLGALVLAYLLHRVLGPPLERRLAGLTAYDRFLHWAIVAVGIGGRTRSGRTAWPT